jgi:2-methylcitrate dehydratase PrpD
MTLARELVRACRSIAGASLPAHVELAARLHFLDAIGVGLAAAGSPVGAAYRGLAQQCANGGPATMLGARTGASAADAALVNGGLMHSLEYDDTHTASIVHGSSVIAATALAAAEGSRASGRALLAGYVTGWEALVRFGLASQGGFQRRGFQITSVGGALAAALVASQLGGRTEDESVASIGIALSQASGVFEFLSNGSSVKSLHPGWAAHAGVMAATLARAGMTGPETSLEGRYGLFRHFAGDEEAPERFRAMIGDLACVWHLPDAAFKFHPCCHFLHPFVEAAGMLAARGVAARDVARILCRVPAGEAPIICEPWETKLAPQTGHAARWSLPIAIAARLVEGRVDLATFERPIPPAVCELATRIAWEPLRDTRYPECFDAEIECATTAGGVHTIRIDDVYGNHRRPPGDDAVMAKFRENAARVLPSSAIDDVARAMQELPDARDLAALSAALRQAGESAAAG